MTQGTESVVTDVSSVVNYLGDMQETPVFYAEDRSRDNLRLVPTRVDVRDARHLESPAQLEQNGFELVRHETAVQDFTDQDAALAVYRPEIERLIGELTGASKVAVGNTVLRWSERAGPKQSFINSDPARFVHVDYSVESFHDFARMHLEGTPDSETWLRRRYVAYNIWRVITPPPQDVPLAICDASTTKPDDVTFGEAVIDAPGSAEFRFGSSLYHANPSHRWYWYSDMRPDEALVFKAFDSDEARVQGCPHSAFDHPNCPDDVEPRGSVEIRAYAFY